MNDIWMCPRCLGSLEDGQHSCRPSAIVTQLEGEVSSYCDLTTQWRREANTLKVALSADPDRQKLMELEMKLEMAENRAEYFKKALLTEEGAGDIKNQRPAHQV